MPNHHPTELNELQQQEITELRHHLQTVDAENAALRTGNAKLILALDRAGQLIEALIAFLPEGQPLHPGLETAKRAFREALKDIRR